MFNKKYIFIHGRFSSQSCSFWGDSLKIFGLELVVSTPFEKPVAFPCCQVLGPSISSQTHHRGKSPKAACVALRRYLKEHHFLKDSKLVGGFKNPIVDGSEILRSPVDMEEKNIIYRASYTIPGGCLGFQPSTVLVGGWTHPSEKYARQNWIISPSRDENKKYNLYGSTNAKLVVWGRVVWDSNQVPPKSPSLS